MARRRTWVSAWWDESPGVRNRARTALARLTRSMGPRTAELDLSDREAVEERGRAIADLRNALDALTIDYALQTYESGNYSLRELADFLETKHSTVRAWLTEANTVLSENGPRDRLWDEEDLEASGLGEMTEEARQSDAKWEAVMREIGRPI